MQAAIIQSVIEMAGKTLSDQEYSIYMNHKGESAELSTDEDVNCPLRIRLFGSIEVQVNGQPLPRLRSRKGQELLALLVLRQGRQVERDWLAGVLWVESGESQALANLRLTLTDLRKALGAQAQRLSAPTPRTLSFDLSGATLDTVEFDTGIASGDPARIKRAVALYRAPLLEGFAEDWLLPERALRAHIYLEGLEKLAAAAHEQNDPVAEAEFLRRVLAADPYRESTLCNLLTACAAQGNYPNLTTAYREFRLRLHQELNSQPGAATTALYHRLLDSRPATPAAVRTMRSAGSYNSAPAALPNPLTALLGREKEVDEITACLRTSRLVTLKGPGGSGKTRLAIAIGRLLQEQFEEQVWFVSLAELPDAGRLPETVRNALQLQTDSAEPFEQIVNRLTDQPSLLILDNYEHLIETGARFVRELLAAAPLLRCLVTSRQSLRITGETEYRVQPLALPNVLESVSRMLQFPAVQLFIERASARRTEFELTPDNAGVVIDLCAKLEGIPLAIELVAAWSDVLTPAQMLTRLNERFAFPASQNSETPARHRSLQGAFDGSYALLDDAERRLLRRLSVFAGGWTLEAAESICSDVEEVGTKRASKQSMIVLLKGLVEKSLVLVSEELQQSSKQVDGRETGSPRYQLLEMTRQYAQEQLSNLEREETERSHAEHYLQEARRSEAESLANETYFKQRRAMMPDRENFTAAHRHWQTIDGGRALEMLLLLIACGIWAATIQEQNVWIERLMTQPLPEPSPLQAKLYHYVGRWALHRTLPDWYLLMERALHLAELCGDKKTMADTLYFLGEWNISSGNTEPGRNCLTTALELAGAAGMLVRVASVQTQLISLACSENDFEYAKQMGNALLQSGRGKQHWATTSRALESLATIARLQQEENGERSYLEQALAIVPETESIPRSNMLRSLGRVAARLTDYSAARDYYAQSLVICQESGDLAHEAWTYHGLADVAHREGDETEAIVWERRALRLFELCGEMWSMTGSLHAVARLTLDSIGKTEQTAFLWNAYERLAQESDHPISPEQREELDVAFAALETALGSQAFDSVRKRCAGMRWREIVQSVYADQNPIV